MGTLVENGIAMTDLKRANTLYDPIRREGKLIDLGGVIKVKNKCFIRSTKRLKRSFTIVKN